MISPRTTARACTLRADSLALEGRLTLCGAQAGAVVAPPHPLYGGSLANPVVQSTVQGLLDAAVSTLAFNYRGTEGSEGVATDDLEAATSDYRAALTELRQHVCGGVIAAGYSFGAGTALLTARDDDSVLGLVLIAPPTGLVRAEDLGAFRGRVLAIVGDDDDYAPVPELKARLRAHPGSAIEVLPGVDHFFHFGGLTALHKLVRDHVKAWL